MQRYFSHICDVTDVQADWRSCTYGWAPNAIDILQGSLTCPSYTETGHPFYTVIPRNRPISSSFTTRWGYGGRILDLKRGNKICSPSFCLRPTGSAHRCNPVFRINLYHVITDLFLKMYIYYLYYLLNNETRYPFSLEFTYLFISNYLFHLFFHSFVNLCNSFFSIPFIMIYFSTFLLVLSFYATDIFVKPAHGKVIDRSFLVSLGHMCFACDTVNSFLFKW